MVADQQFRVVRFNVGGGPAWFARKDEGPLVLLDHFDSDLDVTYGEIRDTQYFGQWAYTDVSVERSELEDLFTPHSIVSLGSRFGFDYGQEALAKKVASLCVQLRERPGAVIVLCSRSILRSDAVVDVLRGLRWTLEAAPLYERGSADSLLADLRTEPLALHVGANSPSLAVAANLIQRTASNPIAALRQFAGQAVADDQLEAAIRAEIALKAWRQEQPPQHPTRGVATGSDKPAEIYEDVGEIDCLTGHADLIGPLGVGKSTALRAIEWRLVSKPSRNSNSAYTTPVWLPLYVMVDELGGDFAAGAPKLLDYLRERIALKVPIGEGGQQDCAGLRNLLGFATSLGDFAKLVSSPILFLLDVAGTGVLQLARGFVEEIRRNLPASGCIVAHENLDAPLTDRVVTLSLPDLDLVKEVLGCSDHEVFDALNGPGDAAGVLTNWSLLRMLEAARRHGARPLVDSKTLIEGRLLATLDDPALADEDRRDAFAKWIIDQSPGRPQFESLARRLGLLPFSHQTSGWVQKLLTALRWRGLVEGQRNDAVREWLQSKEEGLEAPTLLLRLLEPRYGARLLQDLARTNPVWPLRLLNRLPDELAHTLDQLGQISEQALAFATSAASPITAANGTMVPQSAILRGLSRRDPRMALPPKTVSYALHDAVPAQIGQYPTTRSQFEAFVRDRGYERRELWKSDVVFQHARRSELAARRLWNLKTQGLGNAPITDVTLSEAAAFCAWLNQGWGDGYALPTADQWDAAAQIGKFLTAIAAIKPSVLSQIRMAATAVDFRGARMWNSKAETPVGLSPPNDIGCYDLFGLVWEWCDSWAEAPQPGYAPSKTSGAVRIATKIRGCPRPSSANPFELLGSRIAPTASAFNLGFRVFRAAPTSHAQGQP